MNNASNEKNKSFNMFIVWIIAAVVLVAAVSLTIFFITRSSGNSDGNEYLPRDYGDEPSGLDEDYSARY